MTGDSTTSHVVIKKEMGTHSDGGLTISHVVIEKDMWTPSDLRFNYISCSHKEEDGDT